jgi:hypothetical protein
MLRRPGQSQSMFYNACNHSAPTIGLGQATCQGHDLLVPLVAEGSIHTGAFSNESCLFLKALPHCFHRVPDKTCLAETH